MVTDIRDTAADDYWQELRSRWGALLSYRYIGKRFGSMNNVEDAPVVLRHDMRNPVGGIMVAPLAISCPSGGGGKSDLEAVPNPVIHSIQILDDAKGVRAIDVIEQQGLKEGRQMSFGRAKIVDADDHARVIAMVESQSAVIGEVPPGLQKFDDDPILHIEDRPDLPPLWRVFGASRREDGHWTLPVLRAELASPDAALHIGPQQVVLEAAAMDLALQATGTDRLQAESSHVMHLARGKAGPFRVDGDVTLGTERRVCVRLVLCDEGNGDRAVTASSLVFRIVE